MKKSQLSMEMVILMAGLLIIFMAVIASFGTSPEQKHFNRKGGEARLIAAQTAASINSVWLAGEGATATVVNKPSFYDDSPYFLTIYPESRRVDVAYETGGAVTYASARIISSAIAGNLINLSGTITINNSGNEVVIT